MTETITSILVLVGGVFAALGGLGILRLPDVLIRMHATTKIGTLACGLIMAAVAVYFGTTEIFIRVVAIVLFLLLTAPLAAHMIGRTAISTGVALWQGKDPVDSPVCMDEPDQAIQSNQTVNSTPPDRKT